MGRDDGVLIRRAAVDAAVPLITDLQLARAIIEALRVRKAGDLQVLAWEDYVSREPAVLLRMMPRRVRGLPDRPGRAERKNLRSL